MAAAFRLWGIPVRVHLVFILMAAALGLLSQGNPFIWIVIVFQGVLMHELGHAFVGRHYGLKPNIELVALGGLTWWDGGESLSPGRSILVSVAGPLVGIVLGGLVYGAHFAGWLPDAAFAREIVVVFVWVNLGFGLLNLIPMLPLDGGNIVASGLEWIRPGHGRRLSCYVSFFFIGVVGALSVYFGEIFITLLLALFAMTTYRVLEAERARNAPAAQGGPPLVQAFAALYAGDGRRLVDLAGKLVQAATDDDARDEAFHLLAWGRLLTCDPAAARDALESMSGERDPDPALEGAFELGRTREALPLLEAALGDRGGDFAEKTFVRALISAGDFDRAASLCDTPAGKELSLESLEQLSQAAFTASAYEPAATLAGAHFERSKDPNAAVHVARAWAALGRVDEGFEWLRTAHRAGLDGLAALESDASLAPLVRHPDWAAFRASFKASAG